jgi:LacI family transcriptional regulator/LacI family repressor for deo operon, udp, cdd, tsx, nupC, and nupG
MRDVAERAGVSVQTVSNLVNGRHNLMKHETRARVEAAMSDLGYRPNLAARTLRSARTQTLCFLVLDEAARFLADPMTDLVIAGIGDVTRDRGYGLLIQAARPDEPAPGVLDPLLEGRADGAFLFLSGKPSLRRWYVKRMQELGFPFILLEPSDDPSVTTVVADDREGARRLTEHLISAGHERIAFVGSAVPWPMIEQRFLGYHDALDAAGIEARSELESFRGDWTATAGATHAETLLAARDAPTAIMCGNDLLAAGVIRAARQGGTRVPEDVAVTGFDDFDFAELVDPALTTVQIPGYELGRVAAELLVDTLEGLEPPERHVVLPVELCLRESA